MVSERTAYAPGLWIRGWWRREKKNVVGFREYFNVTFNAFHPVRPGLRFRQSSNGR
jgi:hypothetical protein